MAGMQTTGETGGRARWIRRSIPAAIVAFVTLQIVPGVQAHTGTAHAGTPHWVLLVFVVVGLAAGGLSVRLLRADRSRYYSLPVLVVGLVLILFGSIGLVEIQVTPPTAPDWTGWFEVLNLLAGTGMVVGSLLLGIRYWPRRPRYTALGVLLAAWVVYPALLPAGGLTNPVGYLIAAAVPATIGYVLWTERRERVRLLLGRRWPRRVGGLALLAFAGFFAFSAGSLTLNPDLGVGMSGEGFVRLFRVGSPLVYWPALEFYVPAIPLAGYVSIGTVLLTLILGGLITLNAASITQQWQVTREVDSGGASVGAVVSSGATACCCCAPAMYGVVGAAFGTAASPVYWAFMDPTSPVGGLFFAGAVSMLLWSFLRSTDPVGETDDDASTGGGTCAAPTA
ncbi:hypothetical protein [Halorientalis regularis]|uniref:Uncharacterized protein n=1 Tax=Halorientalis regularis TaxID=660518 RepID=A0A1G7RXN5_9EURY|nr:hypothetical protein [Halorientalis regularis]SDG14560.1 hypothetical protein SAMN05216218_11643 [Halorientalis regularis]